MKEPKKPWPPSKYQYEKTVDKKIIYTFTEKLGEDYDDDDDEDVIQNTKPVNEVNLAWLLSQVPEGVDPKDVKIDFGYYASSMAFENHWVQFYYNVDVPAKDKEYQAAIKQYKEAAEQYEKDLEAYTKFKKDEQIKTLEKQLQNLKGV